ncbi:hypothetical protein EAO21_29285 [Klebsiella pneumoniae]|nr:hypothetical protein EAO21_29285 [Klebsiella pneumoniae]
MRLQMRTPDGSVIVESNLVSQFYPDYESGGELTIETVSSDGEASFVKVKHSFHQVTHALATAWSVDEKSDAHSTGGMPWLKPLQAAAP